MDKNDIEIIMSILKTIRDDVQSIELRLGSIEKNTKEVSDLTNDIFEDVEEVKEKLGIKPS